MLLVGILFFSDACCFVQFLVLCESKMFSDFTFQSQLAVPLT